MIIKHFCTVKGGRVIHSDTIRWQKQLNALNGKECYITIAKKTKQRSLNQNAYYWPVIVEILSDYFVYTKNEMHEALKWQFLRVEESGKPTRVRSTASLSTVEFEAFTREIREWAQSEYGVYIPEPNECDL